MGVRKTRELVTRPVQIQYLRRYRAVTGASAHGRRTLDDMTQTLDADRELKSRHRALWACGDYARVAEEIIPSLGPILVEAAGIGRKDRVLDVAAGAGNAALEAARRGADVVASDLTPELLDRGREIAGREGLTLAWDQADAEALPYDDASFDVAVSCVGAMFAPYHDLVADELIRVTRPGGTIAWIAWTPQGFIGQVFATMKPFVAPPPPNAQPPALWGDEAHVRALLGERIQNLTAERRQLRVDQFHTPEQFREYFKANYGPTLMAYRALDYRRAAELDTTLDELTSGYLENGVMGWEYLLVTARRA